MIELDDLLPAERLAHSVAVAQLRRGDNPGVNTMMVLGMALLRLMDELDGNYEVLP